MSEIKEQGFVKLLLDGSVATLHYLKAGDKILSLTQQGSKKVDLLKKDNSAKLVVNNDSTNIIDSKITINENKDDVKKLFDELLGLNFTHYKEYSDDLVILEMSIN
ncbi:hypothetical protein EW093_00135 [Thiospirochaeta perfilievii]|uniref:Uncharacterized protein n=1 Tax=Thiospirochaeta perfilievii TaxID=252967 RepID=A0A5C1Q939_9SPIO|nr:hypothetical protein [Thiospirochaeta perfilievii]QEN03174.1 hypothetical protein EW093_00135 [Thiospirochaeta perfilievii]